MNAARPVRHLPDPRVCLARRQLDEMSISAEAQLTLGKRRPVQIKDKEVVGYEVLVEALTAQVSLTLQARGLGGRRQMGCGVFVVHAQEIRHGRD